MSSMTVQLDCSATFSPTWSPPLRSAGCRSCFLGCVHAATLHCQGTGALIGWRPWLALTRAQAKRAPLWLAALLSSSPKLFPKRLSLSPPRTRCGPLSSRSPLVSPATYHSSPTHHPLQATDKHHPIHLDTTTLLHGERSGIATPEQLSIPGQRSYLSLISEPTSIWQSHLHPVRRQPWRTSA